MSRETQQQKPKPEQIGNPLAPPEVQELSKAQFQDWRRHPVSKAVFRYLSDYRDALLDAHMARFVAGNEEPATEADIRARAATCLDLMELRFSSLANFYDDGGAATPSELDDGGEDVPAPRINPAFPIKEED